MYRRCTSKKEKKKQTENFCSNRNLNFLSFSTGKHNVYNIYVAINVPSFFFFLKKEKLYEHLFLKRLSTRALFCSTLCSAFAFCMFFTHIQWRHWSDTLETLLYNWCGIQSDEFGPKGHLTECPLCFKIVFGIK